MNKSFIAMKITLIMAVAAFMAKGLYINHGKKVLIK